MYEYPQELAEYIAEQVKEGNEIFTTESFDGVTILIVPSELDKWIIAVGWYPGEKQYQMINICGKSFNRLKKVMAECEEKQ